MPRDVENDRGTVGSDGNAVSDGNVETRHVRGNDLEEDLDVVESPQGVPERWMGQPGSPGLWQSDQW